MIKLLNELKDNGFALIADIAAVSFLLGIIFVGGFYLFSSIINLL